LRPASEQGCSGSSFNCRVTTVETLDHAEGVRTTVHVAQSVDHDPPPHALGERKRRPRQARLLFALTSAKKLDGLQDGLSGSNAVKPHRFQELGQKAPYATVAADELLVVPLAIRACQRFPAIGCLHEFVAWDPREHLPQGVGWGALEAGLLEERE
jgi:hypothetical protein